MAIRQPAVAGTFYEGDPDRLTAQVSACFAENGEIEGGETFIGAVVPHAGLMYSGHVAAAFYAQAELPRYLRKKAVVANHHADFPKFGIENWVFVPRCNTCLNFRAGKSDLAILPN